MLCNGQCLPFSFFAFPNSPPSPTTPFRTVSSTFVIRSLICNSFAPPPPPKNQTPSYSPFAYLSNSISVIPLIQHLPFKAKRKTKSSYRSTFRHSETFTSFKCFQNENGIAKRRSLVFLSTRDISYTIPRLSEFSQSSSLPKFNSHTQATSIPNSPTYMIRFQTDCRKDENETFVC